MPSHEKEGALDYGISIHSGKFPRNPRFKSKLANNFFFNLFHNKHFFFVSGLFPMLDLEPSGKTTV